MAREIIFPEDVDNQFTDAQGVTWYHLVGTDNSGWVSDREVTLAERPDESIWPAYEDWPPMRLETAAEAKAAGHVDALGNVQSQWIVDTRKMFALQTAARKAEEKEEIPKGQFASEREAAQFAAQTPGLEDHVPSYNPATGRFHLVPRPVAEEDFEDFGESAFLSRQPPARQTPVGDIEDQMLAAALAGDWEKAASFLNLKRAPSRWEVQQFAIQHAETPAELNTIYALAGYPPPLNADGSIRFEPIFGTGMVPVFEPMAAQPQLPAPTSAELRAQGRRQENVQGVFARGGTPEEAFQEGLLATRPTPLDSETALRLFGPPELAPPPPRAAPNEWNTPRATWEAILASIPPPSFDPETGQPVFSPREEERAQATEMLRRITRMEQEGPDLAERQFNPRDLASWQSPTGQITGAGVPAFNAFLTALNQQAGVDITTAERQPRFVPQPPSFTPDFGFLGRTRQRATAAPRRAFGASRFVPAR